MGFDLVKEFGTSKSTATGMEFPTVKDQISVYQTYQTTDLVTSEEFYKDISEKISVYDESWNVFVSLNIYGETSEKTMVLSLRENDPITIKEEIETRIKLKIFGSDVEDFEGKLDLSGYTIISRMIFPE
jgi:hypothetical protein